MSLTAIPSARACVPARAHSSALPIDDGRWQTFIDEICKRLRSEEEIAFLHPVLATLFQFETPFFPELQRRAGLSDLRFRFTGYHWRRDGEPSGIVFMRR
jgi:hypothetical protein